MKKEEEIFNHFKENQNHWDQTPSPQSWKRLESMLDQRRKRRRKSFYIQTLAAASVVLIIGMVTALSVFEHKKSPNTALTIDTESSAVVMNDPKTSVMDYKPIIMSHNERQIITENDRKFQDLRQKEIDESKYRADGKILKPGSPSTNKEQFADLQPNKKDNRQTEKSDAGILYSYQDTINLNGSTDISIVGNNTSNSVNDGAIADEVFAEEITINEFEKPNFPKIEPEEKEPLSTDDLTIIEASELPTMEEREGSAWIANNTGPLTDDRASKDRAKAQEKLAESKKEQMGSRGQKGATAKNKKQKNKSTITAPNAPVMADKPSSTESSPDEDFGYQYNSTRNFDEAEDMAEFNGLDSAYHIQNIQLFEWLVGQWADESGRSKEKWVKTDNNTIKGEGSYLANGQLVFTENMKIQEINNLIYFVVAIDDSDTEMYFKLKSYDNQRAVFENGNLNFPNQVILERKSDDSFSTIMQNASPVQISPAQQNYFQNRNQINSERAYRNLKRTAN